MHLATILGAIALLLLFVGVIYAKPAGASAAGSLAAWVEALAIAIARAEGFYAAGNPKPRRLNNPGDLKNPATGELRFFETAELGWEALFRQCDLMLTGRSRVYSPDMTIAQIAMLYTGGDNPDSWASTVAQHLGVSEHTTLVEWMGGGLPEAA